jgi:hypothetical protein
MIGRVATRLWTYAASAVVVMAAMLTFPTAAFATYLDVTVTPVLPQVSISVPPRLSYAQYTVTITNNTNSNISGLSFFGLATGVPSNAIATFKEASITCVSAPAQWDIRCDFGPVAKHTAVHFTVTYIAPTSGDQLRLAWALYDSTGFPASETAASYVNLVDQTAADIATRFETIVPSTGGTFYTGTAGGSSTIPGSAPTKLDPFTTTVIIPSSSSSTTASVAEAVLASSCSANYSQCYESNVTIPGTFAHLTIYLRIDSTRLTPFSNLANAVIYYQHSTSTAQIGLQNCGPSGPSSGVPCIESRQKYTAANAPTPEWKGDWEFKIQALDNGRYIN